MTTQCSDHMQVIDLKWDEQITQAKYEAIVVQDVTNELCVSESIKYYVHQPAGASDYTADVIHLCTIMKFVTIE